jgi:hypothetical protein
MATNDKEIDQYIKRLISKHKIYINKYIGNESNLRKMFDEKVIKKGVKLAAVYKVLDDVFTKESKNTDDLAPQELLGNKRKKIKK